jgi:hypothetical protein
VFFDIYIEDQVKFSLLFALSRVNAKHFFLDRVYTICMFFSIASLLNYD